MSYVVQREGQEIGPLSKTEIAARVRSKELSMADECREVGLSDWGRIGDLFLQQPQPYAIAGGESAVIRLRRAPDWAKQLFIAACGIGACVVAGVLLRLIFRALGW